LCFHYNNTFQYFQYSSHKYQVVRLQLSNLTDFGLTSGTTLIPDVIIHAAEAWASTDSTPLIDAQSQHSDDDTPRYQPAPNTSQTSHENPGDQVPVLKSGVPASATPIVVLTTGGSSSLPQLSLQSDQDEPKTNAKTSSPLKIGNYSLNALNNNYSTEIFEAEITRSVNVQDLDHLATTSGDFMCTSASEEEHLICANSRPPAPSYSSFVNRRTKSNESNACQSHTSGVYGHSRDRDNLHGESRNSCSSHLGTQDPCGGEHALQNEQHVDFRCSTVVTVPPVSSAIVVDSLGNYTVRVVDPHRDGSTRPLRSSLQREDGAHVTRPRRRLVGCGWSRSQELVETSKPTNESLTASRRRKTSLSLRIPKAAVTKR